MPSAVRRAAVAGTWYPGEPKALVAELERCLEAARPQPLAGRLVGLISPHAGLRYSGPVAAWGYGLLRERKPRTVVLVGPSHRFPFRGVSIWPGGEWQTPLGPIPIDEPLTERILAAGGVLQDDPRPHEAEHSLEMQLPFLKHLLPEVRIVAALMGSQTRDEVDALALALQGALEDDDDTLLVASSDLSHYHPASSANRLDAVVLDHLRRLDVEGLMSRLESDHEHACGGGPIVAVMKTAAARAADSCTILKYGDSGDVEEGDKSRVVGYVSAALTGSAS